MLTKQSMARLLLSASVVATSAGVGGAAVAQTSTDQAISSIEEVVVTARKREESLQTVPVAVSSVSGEALAQQTIRQPTDLTRAVPSVTIGSNAGTVNAASISLRGQVPGDVLLNVSQPVGLYEDSVNIPHPVGANAAFIDLARVEVLKGPQGTLYGRNTTGGAVNIITRGADYNGTHGFIEGEAGNYASYRIAGAGNLVIVPDKLAARLALQHWQREGYGDAPRTGQELGGDHDDQVARLSVLIDPVPSVHIIAKYEYVEANREGALNTARAFTLNTSSALEAALFTNFGANAALLATNPAAAIGAGIAAIQSCVNTDFFTSCQGTKTSDNVKARHAVFDATWDITDNVALRSISGYHWFENFRVFDLDATPYILTEVGAGNGHGGIQPNLGTYPGPFPKYPYDLQPDQSSEQFSQEFNLTGSAGDTLEWLVGAFYASDEGSGAQLTAVYPTLLTTTTGGLLGVGYDANKVTNETWALFTQNDIKFNDIVSVTLGARYTEERLGQTLAAWQYIGSLNLYSCVAGPALPQTTGDACNVDQSAKFSGTSYLASLNLQFTPDTLLYFRTARGFRGGALQGRAPDFPAAAPEIAEDYEIGFKADFFDKRLRTNAAIFQTNYSNKQEQVISPNRLGNATTVLNNAADARIRGVELDWQARPIAALNLYGAFTYLDGQYLTYKNALTPQSLPQDRTTWIDASGVEFAQPHYRYNIGARYQVDIGDGVLGAQADYFWRDEAPITRLTRDNLVPLALQKEFNDSLGLLNARVDYAMPKYGLTVAAWVTNLTDEEYQTATISPSINGVTVGATQEPRMYGVTLRKTFGDE